MMGHHDNTEPIPLSERRADLPPSLEVAVLKALAKDPEERFYDFSLFLEVVQSMASSPPAFPFINAPHSHSRGPSRIRASRQKQKSPYPPFASVPLSALYLSSLNHLKLSSTGGRQNRLWDSF